MVRREEFRGNRQKYHGDEALKIMNEGIIKNDASIKQSSEVG